MRSAPTASATSRTTITSSGRRRRWKAAAPRPSPPPAPRIRRPAVRARGDRSTGILQHYYVLPLYALVRFGRWREILEETLPPDVAEPYPQAIWHYARGTAYARTRPPRRGAPRARCARATGQRSRARARPDQEHQSGADAGQIAVLTLTADIAAAEGRPAAAVAPLVAATALEDALTYDEPHLWLAPTRHALGAALLAAGRPAEAEKSTARIFGTIRRTGGRSRDSPTAQRRQGHLESARATEARFRAAWPTPTSRSPASRF